MSELNKCLLCDGEVDWCKNNLEIHNKNDECHYIHCDTCGEFNFNFPDDLDWPEIYKYIADKWNNRASTPNAKIQKFINETMECCDMLTSIDVLDGLENLIKPEGE